MEMTSEKILILLGSLQDYIERIKLTVVEAGLLLLSLMWCFWFAVFDVVKTSVVFKYIWNQSFWVGVYGMVGVMHLVGLIFDKTNLRLIAAYCYSFIWATWITMSGMSNINALGVPVFLFITILSIALAVRLSRQ